MPRFRMKAYVKPEVVMDFIEKNGFTKSQLSTLLGFNANFVNDLIKRRSCGYPSAQTVCKELNIPEYEFIESIYDRRTGKSYEVGEVEEKVQEQKETKLQFQDYPFSEEDYLVPKKPDVVISTLIVGNRRTVKITFSTEAKNRLDRLYVRIAIRDDKIFFIGTNESDEAKYVVSDAIKGISIIDDGCVKRIEKYIGKYDLKYNELFNIFYVEGVPNE